MIQKEYEIVEHNRLSDVKLFLVDLAYRNLHMHHDFELCLVLDGQVSVFTQRKTYFFMKDSLILFNPKQPHEIHSISNDPAMILSLQFSPKFCARYFPLIRNLEFSDASFDGLQDATRKPEIIQTLLTLACHYLLGSEGFELMVYSQLNLLVNTLIKSVAWHQLTEDEKRQKANISDRLSRILDYIDKHFTEKILLQDLARLENLSLSYLSHFLKDHLNMTFQEYIALLRFEEARALVERSNMNLIDICIASGFSDQRYMTKIFQKQLGFSPSDYREKLKAIVPPVIKTKAGALQNLLTISESVDYLKGYGNFDAICK